MIRLLAFLSAALCLTIVGAGFVQAGDLDKIDRPRLKEPAYQSESPKYALLVFGPEARTRIWLVLDGILLYVDRNGNGDLTESGEKVAGKKSTVRGEDAYTFTIGELRDGSRRHRNATLTVTEVKSAAGRGERSMEFFLRMDVDMPGYRGTGEGGRVLQLAGTSDFKGDL